jgi:hypothetical protein
LITVSYAEALAPSSVWKPWLMLVWYAEALTTSWTTIPWMSRTSSYTPDRKLLVATAPSSIRILPVDIVSPHSFSL